MLYSRPSLFSQTGVSDAGITDEGGGVDVRMEIIWETVVNMIDGFLNRLSFIVAGILVPMPFYLFAGFVRKLVRNSTKGERSDNLGWGLGRVSQVILIFLGLVIGVATIAPSITPAKLLASLGGGGVAIGFAFNDIMQNFLARILLLLKKPFRVGDQIVTGDHEGVVEPIETRVTLQRKGWPDGNNLPQSRNISKSIWELENQTS